MKKKYFICSILLIHSLIYAQLTQEPVIYLPQGYVLDGLSVYGYNKTTKSTGSNINGSNPACVQDFYRRNVSISYQFDSKIKEAWIEGIGYSRIVTYKPQSFSLVFPYDNFRIAFAVSHLFNAETDYGNFYMTRIDTTDPRGYVETGIVHLRKQEIVYKNSITFSYNFSKLFHSSDTLHIGFRYNSNHLECKHNIGMPTGTINRRIFEPNFSIGIRYDLPHFDGNSIKLGCYYESEINFDKKTEIDNVTVQYIGFIPEKLHVGLMYKMKSKILLSSDLSILFWENIDKEYSSKNQLDFNLNTSYSINKSLHISFGVLRTNRKYANNDSIYNLNNLKATYLITGLVYYYRSYSFELIMADSHLFSDEWRKQRIGKFTVGYNF